MMTGVTAGAAAGAGPCEDTWNAVPSAFRAANGALPPPWDTLFGPLRTGTVDDLMVVGQIGQSLDGRIATTNGHSHYINGLHGRTHLHRLRALVDAVVVGVGTALADDPIGWRVNFCIAQVEQSLIEFGLRRMGVRLARGNRLER